MNFYRPHFRALAKICLLLLFIVRGSAEQAVDDMQECGPVINYYSQSGNHNVPSEVQKQQNQQDRALLAGPPGKRGPAGQNGETGMKGDQGETGQKV